MNVEEFEALVDRRLDAIEATLKTKRAEYARSECVFSNFRRGAEITGESQEQVLVGYMTKHLVCVLDMLKSAQTGVCPQDRIDEKFTDLMAYLLLGEAMLSQHRQRK